MQCDSRRDDEHQRTFVKCKEVESLGIRLAESWLKRRFERVVWLESDNETLLYELQINGDCACFKRNGEVVCVEIKTDMFTTRRMAIEVYSNRRDEHVASEDDRDGWIKKSKADRLLYIYPNTREAYWVDMKELQAWATKDDFAEIKAANIPLKVANAEQRNVTRFYAVPLWIIRRRVRIKNVDLFPKLFDATRANLAKNR